MGQCVRYLDYQIIHTILSPIRRGFVPGFVNYKKGCTWLAAASDKVYQLLAHGRWFSLASSTTKTGRHDIAEILLKGALIHQKSKSNQINSTSINMTLSLFFSISINMTLSLFLSNGCSVKDITKHISLCFTTPRYVETWFFS